MSGCPFVNKNRDLLLRNYHDQEKNVYDRLQRSKNKGDTVCSSQVCLGSLMSQHGRNSTIRSTSEVLVQAKDFLEQYFTSIRRANTPAHTTRWEQVQKEVTTSGTYQLTETELIYGAKLAWRNSVRCIGRIQWSKLQAENLQMSVAVVSGEIYFIPAQLKSELLEFLVDKQTRFDSNGEPNLKAVFDCRYVTTTSSMFEALCNHIKYSTNKGNIRSAITIFPQRTDNKHDFRVWNSQLVGYAGYKQADGTILGDPANVEFTEVCMKLGWRGAGTRFDILPLVLSANGHDPDYFDIPAELILEVNLSHPNYDWFEELGLKWYALPAVSNMMFDCGGIQFTAAPFNGWYMSTEIGCRDLCDTQRYNQLEIVAQKMGLDTRTAITLWKDKAMVECNVAVLYSFQIKGVTIVDHHTASESFMKHMENEVRLRNGCPADWVWIVPPLSGSATPVFHQEMALYFLKPSYEYQDPAWRTHVWKKGRDSNKCQTKPKRKFHFKQIARAVKFTSKLFGRALSRRIKATVLYATETGKSEGFAKKLGEIFGHAFNAQVYCMSDYDISNIEHEALLLVVTSTFGNGDPPENGEEFARNLYTLKMNEQGIQNGDAKLSMTMQTSKSFIKANSQSDINVSKKLDRFDSWRESVSEPLLEDTFGPLSNVRFAVFALGSSAYPNFCAFGQYVDNLLLELGGERLLKMACGDEMCGQEQAFKKWAPEIFRVACETFCLDDDDAILEATITLQTENLTQATVKFVEAKPMDEVASILKAHNKKISLCKLLKRTNLHGENSTRATLKVELESNLHYNPGDHVGVYPKNKPELVEKIIERLKGVDDPDAPVELQILTETQTSNGVVKQWSPHEKIPARSVRELFSKFLDITTPPSSNLLQQFAAIATDEEDQKRLNILATDSAAYEDWRYWRYPNLLEVLEEFPSVNPYAPLLVAQLSLLQPRFYSISSSRAIYPNQINLTVAVVVYRTQDGDGPVHYGVASNYLQDAPIGEEVSLFVRSAPSFYLPTDPTRPIVVVGPGTGIAPFVAFWQQRKAQAAAKTRLGKCWLFFGCRQKELDLYSEEKQLMVANKIIDRTFLALSRQKEIKKTYVQDLLREEAAELYKMIVLDKGHFYVCGDVTMADHVYQTLKTIMQTYGNMTDEQVEKFMLSMRDENRYHEDIFGITLRTAEVHNRSRESARIRMASEP